MLVFINWKYIYSHTCMLAVYKTNVLDTRLAICANWQMISDFSEVFTRIHEVRLRPEAPF